MYDEAAVRLSLKLGEKEVFIERCDHVSTKQWWSEVRQAAIEVCPELKLRDY